MGEVIVVVSGKGGVGKTTVTANVGAALAEMGKRVLLIDADMGLRNLDITLGVENQIVYDVADVLDGICSLEAATVKNEKLESLHFIPAPQSRGGDCVAPEALEEFCRKMSEKYDYILIDGPAGVGAGFLKILKSADKAIVVTQAFMAAVRDADRTVSYLEKENIKEIFVLINSISSQLVDKGVMLDADYIMDVLGIKLIGIIPYDEKVMAAAGKGELVAVGEKCDACVAFSNVAARICGEKVPIMEFSKEKKKKFSLFKKQYRR